MQAIIQFIHLGQTEVREEDLDRLMRTARDLQIEGLYADCFVNDNEIVDTNNYEGENISEQEYESSSPETINNEDVPKEVVNQINGEYLNDICATKENIVQTELAKFQCQDCEYQTDHSSHLKQHVSSIHKKAKHPCKECDKVFATTSGLGEHRRGTHNGIRLQCDECDNVFAYASGIRMNKKVVHDGLRYPCDGCSYKATIPSSLKKHIFAKHL